MSPTSTPERNLERAGARRHFVARKHEIDTMLARLRALSDGHFGLSPDEITWAT